MSKGIALMMKYVKEHLKNTMLAEMLIQYYLLYENTFLNKELESLVSFEVNLPNIEEQLKGIKEGKNFFPFWYFLSYPITSEKEKYDLADKYFDSFLIRNYFENVGWVFMSYMPASGELRKSIFEESQKLKLSKDVWQQDLWAKLLSQEIIKREMEKKHPEVAKPLFNVRRKIYSEILAKKTACSYAFYQLVALGDEQKNYLDLLNSCPE
ncbi:MAG: hypothetical protein ACOYL6_01870 [Bacteriovoracaceae bacterium]